MPYKKLISILIFVVLMFGFFYVWPTMYRYGTLGVIPVRWNRVSSNMQYLSLQGWSDQLPITNDDAPSTFRIRPHVTPLPVIAEKSRNGR